MSNPVYPATDLARNYGDLLQEAIRHPVTITQYRKPRFVLMSYDEYNRLKDNGDPRRSYHSDDMPEDVAEDLRAGLEDFLATQSEPAS